MSLLVTCPHCGAHGEMTDMLEQVRFVNMATLEYLPPVARFTCCGLWGDLAVAEPTPEEAQ